MLKKKEREREGYGRCEEVWVIPTDSKWDQPFLSKWREFRAAHIWQNEDVHTKNKLCYCNSSRSIQNDK